jgi:hypothetical protein
MALEELALSHVLCDTQCMSDTLSIRIPVAEKVDLKRLADQLGEDLAEFARTAIRQRAAEVARGKDSAWAKYAGCVNVTVPPPTNAVIRAAMRQTAP